MKKNTRKIKVIGAILAIAIMLSTVLTFSVIGASAAAVPTPHAVSSGSTHIVSGTTNAGYDWWYPWNWKAPYHPVI